MEISFSGIVRRLKSGWNPDKRRTKKLLRLFENKEGIEIGGPSPVFAAHLPIYEVAKSLDGVNFSTNTVWEGSIQAGWNYRYHGQKAGYQFICEASDLKEVPSGKYDFLLASHCLEHCANALKTVEEWLRVIKDSGYLLLILPDKQYTFDHRRPTTTFEHLLADYAENVDESDMTHLDEILTLHDLTLDKAAGDLRNFKERSLHNAQNRCLHHHVFDFDLLRQLFSHFGLKIIFEKSDSLNQIIVGQKHR